MTQLDRLERVTDLLLVLVDTPRPLSLREIADRVPGYPESHAARRQAFERDKRLLRDEGVPVESVTVDGADQIGYRVDPEAYYLPDLHLESDEQAALNLAVAGVHLGEPTGRDALSKLGAAAEAPVLGALAAPVVDLPSVRDLPALPPLCDALRQSATVSFRYRGETRHADPVGLRFRRGHWYLLAADRDRGAPRTFRVDRIESAPRVGDPGSGRGPDGVDPDDAFSLVPWEFGTADEVTAEVWVDPVEAGRVVAEVGEEAVADRGDDGSVVVRLAVSEPEAFLHWVLGLLDHAEVVAPAPLRAAVVARLEALAGGEAPR